MPAHTLNVTRYRRLASTGDLDAIHTLAQHVRRIHDLDTLRWCAWQAFLAGASPFTLRVANALVPPLTPTEGADALSAPVHVPRFLTQPFDVPCLWDRTRERRFALDCVHHLLTQPLTDPHLNTLLHRALDAATQHAPPPELHDLATRCFTFVQHHQRTLSHRAQHRILAVYHAVSPDGTARAVINNIRHTAHNNRRRRTLLQQHTQRLLAYLLDQT